MDIKERFTQVIKENKGLIFKIAILYTDSIEDRDDLYQEIVYQLWKSFPSFKEHSKISTWMYKVALNTAIYHLKKNKRQLATIPIEREVLNLGDRLDHIHEERLEMLYEHIQRLSLLEKGIILLWLEENNHEEIAAIVGLSISNVGTRLSRIRNKLKVQIAKSK